MAANTGTDLLELIGVSKEFHVRSGGRRATLSAVDTVSLTVRQGTTLGIVGESGCGKSTLARVIVGLHLAEGGEMIFDGKQVLTHRRRSPTELKQMQMVFQDPSSALNPRATISESIGFPLQVQGESRAMFTRCRWPCNPSWWCWTRRSRRWTSQSRPRC
jgi:ABC-type glutathione transport system ATPase component